MTNLQPFTKATARMLPVILLADVSGSMSVDGKINALNEAVREMIAAFADEVAARASIHVAIITFGGQARLHQSLATASDITWVDMATEGNTPLGAALDLASDLIDSRDQLPSTAYRPTVVLVSDGWPNDDWERKLNAFNAGRRTGRTQRLAMGIGSDADEAMLRRFVVDSDTPIFHAEDASQIASFFRYVSQSVTVRSRSTNPNILPQIQDPNALEEF